MIAPNKPNDEALRLQSLHRMNLLSTAREPDLDTITRVAQRHFGVEIALISLVDEERQWFKSRCGLDVMQTGRDISFCGHVVELKEPLIVNNALDDERFYDNPLVIEGLKIRFYAGQPLTNAEGFVIGTLCLISASPRAFTDGDRAMLKDLGHMAEVVLDSRMLSQSQKDLLQTLQAVERDSMIDPLSGLWNRRGLDEFLLRELNIASREHQPITFAMIDIDDFKKINDKFGHCIGDQAIKLTAELLTNICRVNDVVARIGGEEFALILPGSDAYYIPTIGDKILRQFREYSKIKTDLGPCQFNVSMGFAVAMPKESSLALGNTYLDQADKALYAAKANGKNCYKVFEAT